MPGRTRLGALAGAAMLILTTTLSLGAPALAHDDAALEFVFPQDPLATHFVNSFGDPRSGGRRHHGTDLMAPKLTPIYAVADGIVTVVRNGGSAGRWIAIEHAFGWESWYMHLNNDSPGTDDGRADREWTYAEDVVVGRLVRAGDFIGYVGDSGNAEGSGAHTHFELHHDGRVVNPYPYLVDAYARALEDLPLAEYLSRISEDLVGIVK